MRKTDFDPSAVANVSEFEPSNAEARRAFPPAPDEGLRLIRAFMKIQDQDRRNAVLRLVRDLSERDI